MLWRSLLLGLAACLLSVTNANAALVSFTGVISSQIFGAPGVGFLGLVPPTRSFTMSLFVTDGPSPGTVTGGSFVVSGGPGFVVTGGNATLTDAGASDTAAFVVNVLGPTAGLLNMTFSGSDFFSSNAINQVNFDKFVYGRPTTGVNIIDFGTFVGYSGTIQAIPEPGTMALMGLFSVGGGYAAWRKKRRQAA